MSDRELFRVKAFWLLDPFPDELIILQRTVSLIHRRFLYSYVETVSISDIGEVELTEAGNFASLTVIGKPPSHNLEIENLTKQKAEKAKGILDTLILENR